MAECSPEDGLVGCRIVGPAFVLHRTPGPGLPESVYQQCRVGHANLWGLFRLR
jgi:hypothetical protein